MGVVEVVVESSTTTSSPGNVVVVVVVVVVEVVVVFAMSEGRSSFVVSGDLLVNGQAAASCEQPDGTGDPSDQAPGG